MDTRAAFTRLSITTHRLLQPSIRTKSRPSRTIISRTRPAVRFYSGAAVAVSVPEHPNTMQADLPRWKQTPSQMKMPFRVRTPAQAEFPVNNDPDKLHAVYDKILGKGAWQKLTEETRWLAVTHKSFDQGRRGFNDRLAYLGRRIVELQFSLSAIESSRGAAAPSSSSRSKEKRTPFAHEKLRGIERLSEKWKADLLNVERISRIAQSLELDTVVRWKPRWNHNLSGSGWDMVMTEALYAVVGAVSLENGLAEANKVAREKIIRPLRLEKY